MSKYNNAEYKDQLKLSREFIEYIKRDLSKRNLEVSNSQIAKEIGVSMSRISQVINNNDSDSLPYKVVARYAAKKGKSFSVFAFELMDSVYDDNTNVEESQKCTPMGSGSNIEQALELYEMIDSQLTYPKERGQCKANLFFDRVLEKGYLYLKTITPALRSMSLFGKQDNYIWLSVKNEEIKKKPLTITTNINNIPSNIHRLLEKTWIDIGCPVNFRTYNISRLNKEQEEDHSNIYKHFLANDEDRDRDNLRVYALRIYRRDYPKNNEGNPIMDYYTITLFFVFDKNYILPIEIKAVMYLLKDLLQKVCILELETNVNSLMQTIGIPLSSRDMRPHASYYSFNGEDFSNSFEQIEASVESFLKKITIRENLFAAEIWSYDWTDMKFTELSQYFRYLNDKYRDSKILTKEGAEETYYSVYQKGAVFEPRPYGKTNCIFKSRQPIYIQNFTEDPCFKSLGITNGSIIGVPIMLKDRQNNRVIHGVLYLRVLYNNLSLKTILQNIIHLAQKEYKNINIVLESSMEYPDSLSYMTELSDTQSNIVLPLFPVRG
jgi:transcriptional regulator with XRE-family HTH domain